MQLGTRFTLEAVATEAIEDTIVLVDEHSSVKVVLGITEPSHYAAFSALNSVG